MSNFTIVSPRHLTPIATALSAALLASLSTTAYAQPNNANAFNTPLSIVLSGVYGYSQKESEGAFNGYPNTSAEAAAQGFSIGEAELTYAGNIDQTLKGQLTAAFGDGEAGIEEAFVQTLALPNNATVRAGRFLSNVGYVNSRHAHTLDFVTAPLVQQAMFGEPLQVDGLQARWLAPTDTFIELGAEIGSGSGEPAGESTGKKPNTQLAFISTGDDIGNNASYKIGASVMRNKVLNKAFSSALLSGNSNTVGAFGVYKWQPSQSSSTGQVKLQGEYFVKNEKGVLTDDASETIADAMKAKFAGGYIEGVYQWQPRWRAGLRLDQLSKSRFSQLSDDQLSALQINNGKAAQAQSVMIDYAPSEFSRWRMQLSNDQSRADSNLTMLLQYTVTLGAHPAHQF